MVELPFINFEPVNTTFNVCNLFPVSGEMLTRIGAGLFTVNAFGKVNVPPPGVEFVIVTPRVPVDAETVITIRAEICRVLLTVVFKIVIPFPKLTAVVPLKKFVPTRTTSKVSSLFPLMGETDVNVGAGYVIVKPFVSVEVPPPGEEFDIITFLVPTDARVSIVNVAVSCVELFTFTVPTEILFPKFTDVIPLIKFVPPIVTDSV